MKIIRNRFIPFKGFSAINLFGVLFVREDASISKVVMNHEDIHTAQMKELGYVFFYLIYVLEWIVRLFVNGPKKAYRNISFEKEAYAYESYLDYVKIRKRYAQWLRNDI